MMRVGTGVRKRGTALVVKIIVDEQKKFDHRKCNSWIRVRENLWSPVRSNTRNHSLMIFFLVLMFLLVLLPWYSFIYWIYAWWLECIDWENSADFLVSNWLTRSVSVSTSLENLFCWKRKFFNDQSVTTATLRVNLELKNKMLSFFVTQLVKSILFHWQFLTQ